MNIDVIIIGAGASGLIAAIAAARKGSSVLVIEQKEKAGKKLLATGNGKCNFTNLYQTPECYRSDDSAFAMKVLSCFDVHQTIQFFEELGIFPKERNGYLYPNSEQAASVLDVLLMECRRLGVTFQYGEKAVKIEKPDYTVITQLIEVNEDNRKDNNTVSNQKTGKAYNIKKTDMKDNRKTTDKKSEIIETGNTHKYHANKLILAAGGCASPKLGSDGSGYRLAKGLGHTIIKPLPALVQLKASDKYCKTISGVRTAAKVTAIEQDFILACEEGEIIFTDYGISGIPIMQLSRFAAKALDQGKNVQLVIDFLQDKTKEEIYNLIEIRIRHNSEKTIEEMMIGLFNHKLSYIMIKEARLDPLEASVKMSKKDIFALIQQIKEFRMTITDTNSFENAQVCAGGISTKEVNTNTLESKLSKNLYLVGELLDVDGTCGGYNLQWAWSTGFLAGTEAGNKKL